MISPAVSAVSAAHSSKIACISLLDIQFDATAHGYWMKAKTSNTAHAAQCTGLMLDERSIMAYLAAPPDGDKHELGV